MCSCFMKYILLKKLSCYEVLSFVIFPINFIFSIKQTFAIFLEKNSCPLQRRIRIHLRWSFFREKLFFVIHFLEILHLIRLTGFYIHLCFVMNISSKSFCHGLLLPQCEECSYSEFFWSVFSRIWTEYALYSVRMWENMDQKNSEYGHFSRSERFIDTLTLLVNNFVSYYLIGEKKPGIKLTRLNY